MTESDAATTSESLSDQISDLVAAEARSLVRHVESAKPYLSSENYQTWTAIQHLSAASHQHEQRLAELIKKLGLTLRPGVFQQEVAHYHDMNLQGLIPRLIEEKRRQAAAYQRALEHTLASQSVAQELQALLDEVEDQLKQLQAARA